MLYAIAMRQIINAVFLLLDNLKFVFYQAKMYSRLSTRKI